MESSRFASRSWTGWPPPQAACLGILLVDHFTNVHTAQRLFGLADRADRADRWMRASTGAVPGRNTGSRRNHRVDPLEDPVPWCFDPPGDWGNEKRQRHSTTTSNKTLLGAPGLTTSNKDATNGAPVLGGVAPPPSPVFLPLPPAGFSSFVRSLLCFLGDFLQGFAALLPTLAPRLFHGWAPFL